MFSIGQKVEKFETGVDPDDGRETPRVGGIYVVTRIRHSARWPGEAVIGIVGFERLQRAIRFRPIVERNTDISFAHEILRKASKPVKIIPATVSSADRGSL